MRKKLTIIPKKTEIVDGEFRRSCHVELSNGKKIPDLWWSYPIEIPAPHERDSDAYLVALIMLAMHLKADVEILGVVSRSLLANLVEFQRAWNKWCPDAYHQIRVNAQHIRDGEKSTSCAVAAFSGGIDAQFTVYSHMSGSASYDKQDIAAGVLVHGFDIPLADRLGFDRVAADARLVLNDLNLKLFAVRTNIREVININWNHYCGAALASVLSGFKAMAGIGLIGSTDAYDEILMPWGTNPITDPLLGSSEFAIKHDGSGFNRVEKIKILSDWPIGMRYLRVCWEGDVVHKNCGHCEKCVRTRLNFLLAGQPNPMCFDGPLRKQDIDNIALNGEGARVEWKLILKAMKENCPSSEFIPNVERVLRRPVSRWSRLLPVGSKRRAWMKHMVGKN